MVLAEKAGHKILLTGDGRGDIILQGLEQAGAVAPGATLEVDILKLPHHGSSRNIAADFFQRIKAKHYIISANGRNGNPDVETLQLLTSSRGDDAYTIHLTNNLTKCTDLFAADRATNPSRKYKVVTGSERPPYLRVDLGDENLHD